MVKLDILYNEGKISKISELEIERYTNFFDKSYKDNLSHCEFNLDKFPRWSIISGYYAMHDITKLFLAKKFRIKIEFEVHATAIKVLAELIQNKELLDLIQKGYREFLNLANDLEEAKKERVKAQYYTGTEYSLALYKNEAVNFKNNIVLVYLEKIVRLLK